MAYANFFGIERFDNWRGKLRQSDAGRAICRALSDLRGDLLDAVLRVFQVEQSLESLRFLQWVNVAALQVFDLSLVPQKLSMTYTTMTFCTSWNPYL